MSDIRNACLNSQEKIASLSANLLNIIDLNTLTLCILQLKMYMEKASEEALES